MRALSGRSRVAAIIVPCGLQKVRRKRNRRNSAPSQSCSDSCACPWHPCCQPRGAASSGQPSFWAAHARTIHVYVTWRAESQVQEQVEKLNGRRIRRSKSDRIEYGSPARGKSAQRLEHDPEKWIPVFGKDHAPTKAMRRASFGAACGSTFKEAPNCQPAAGLLLSVGCLNWRPSPTNIRYFVRLGARSKHH